MKIRILTYGGALALTYGCATVPDDAPQEFKSAEAALERMDDQDADEELPKTTERAEDTFSRALDMLEDARDGDSGASESAAIQEAINAEELATSATKISEDIRSWDKNSTALQDALAKLERDLDSEQYSDRNAEPSSPFAMLEGIEFKSTVAFFETGDSESPTVNEPEIEALVGILNKSDRATVTVTGFADHRGSTELNQRLSKERAQTIAEKIYSNGIDRSRVKVEAKGEGSTEANSAGKLQLDRKVTVSVAM